MLQSARLVVLLISVSAALVQAAGPACPILDDEGCCGASCQQQLCSALYTFGTALVSDKLDRLC